MPLSKTLNPQLWKVVPSQDKTTQARRPTEGLAVEIRVSGLGLRATTGEESHGTSLGA